jgi:hypothetical protein
VGEQPVGGYSNLVGASPAALNPFSATDLLGSFGTIGVLVVLFA